MRSSCSSNDWQPDMGAILEVPVSLALSRADPLSVTGIPAVHPSKSVLVLVNLDKTGCEHDYACRACMLNTKRPGLCTLLGTPPGFRLHDEEQCALSLCESATTQQQQPGLQINTFDMTAALSVSSHSTGLSVQALPSTATKSGSNSSSP